MPLDRTMGIDECVSPLVVERVVAVAALAALLLPFPDLHAQYKGVRAVAMT